MVLPAEQLDDEPLLLDPGPSPRGWHRLETFLRCPQQYAFKYRGPKVEEPPPSGSSPLLMGSLVHVGLAHYYARMREDQTRGNRDRYYDPEMAVTMLAARRGGGPWYEAADRARGIVSNYVRFWAAKEKYRIHHVEEVFEIRYPCQNGPIRWRQRDELGRLTDEWVEEAEVRLTARLDLVAEDPRGKMWTWDHKTSGRIDAKHPKFYGVSGQLLNYRWIGGAVWGEKYGGVVLNMVQTGGDARFERPQLDPAPRLLARFPQIVEDAERRIAELEAEDRPVEAWPALASEHCYHRYGPCSYLEACKWGL